MTALDDWRVKQHEDMVSRAIQARRLKDEGWSNGDLMNYFRVSARSLARWFKFLEEEIPTGGDN